ncbi:conserved hypothetical protein [Streptomyces clavuligerus]|nr:conserved hypothetical protein [Streptomyces clavuligerus]
MEWADLPAGVRAAVEGRTGPVTDTTTVAEGLNCRLAAVIRTERHGRLFLKGVRDTDIAEAAALQWELALGPVVGGIAPVVRHSVRADGWALLVFDHIDGRHADLAPGTGDLPSIARALTRMTRLRTPAHLTVPAFTDGYGEHLTPGDAELLAGDTLLHTDTNPHNILIGHADGDAHVIDWAMPATGPAWIDAAYTAVRLMECEQPPDDALAWLTAVPAWRRADPRAVESFVNVVSRHWTARVGHRGAEPSNSRFRWLLQAR